MTGRKQHLHNRITYFFVVILLICMVFNQIGSTCASALDDGSTSLSTVCVGADGKKYQIMASYGADSGIPDDAALSAAAIAEDDAYYASYASRACDILGYGANDENVVRLFDISITDRNDSSVKYQPAEGSTVEVKVRLASSPETDLGVVHFGNEPEILPSEVTGRTISFETTGFSVYALVDLPEVIEDRFVSDASEFDRQPLYLSATVDSKTYYISSGIVYDSRNKHYVIARTPENSTSGAVAYYFEKISGTDNQYYIYCLDGETRNYIQMTRNTGMDYVSSSSEATSFTVEPCENGYTNRYFIRTTEKQSGKYYYLNLRKDTNGKGFGGSDYGPLNNLESAGSCLLVEKSLPPTLGLTNLNGKTYGIVSVGEYGEAFALSANTQSGTVIASISVSARANPLNTGGTVVISTGDDIPMYTFRDDGNGKYLVSTSVGGTTKYLSIRKTGAALVDAPDEYSHLTALLGTNEFAGRVCLTSSVGGGSLYATNYGAGGFTAKTARDTMSYFYFALQSELEGDDLVPYTANKISVSDVRNGAKVIVYTRVWDDIEKKYVYYGINHDGTLVRLYDEGETVRWAGTQINTMLWEFTEYYYWFTNIPNNYYELRNTYSHKYLAPQHSNGQILQNRPIGINLNGRRNGQHYSTILAWDNYRYDYAGLRAGDGRVEAVRMSRAQDFYFAVMQPEEGDLTTVETIDNNNYGISMKMVLFPREYEVNSGRNSLQTDVIGNSTFSNSLKHSTPDLMTKHLDEEGYPTATLTGRSLKDLFGAATPVNHLFLSEVYNESGYFQYDSTQTFATLLDEYGNISDTFTVYNELGTPEVSTNSQGHSQFMPYNDLDTSKISSYTNVKDVFNESLPLDDPRLGEQMYSIPATQANYHFGMEMEASFVQSKDGKDAWGHDIIFEFAGDDDMWFYVDGEQILDLGGIHSALVGKINFSTGDVQIPHTTAETGNHATPVYTTLRNIFAENYIERNSETNPGLTIDSPEVVEYLNRFFKPGTSIFKDYTAHTMKMFYMERGSGASNLIMRFNLTTSSEGQLLLTKDISGTDKNDFSTAEFAFQVFYRDEFENFVTVKHDPSFTDGKTPDQYVGVNFVNYEGTTDPVKYESSFYGYDDVFFLKPGETADIQFPSNDIVYYITECRIDQSVFDKVYANTVQLNPIPNGDFADYSTLPEVIGERKIIKYDNHVAASALMTLRFTKELYELYDREEDRLHYADDDTGFRFRLYIGDDLDYYRFGEYYVLDPQNRYCRYDYETQKFIPVGDGITDFEQLTEEQKEDCCFITSPSGAIDQIPADFTVEIRDLFIDTKFMLEENSSDIPKGYDLIGYERDDGTMHEEEGESPNIGTIHLGENPCITVKNHRGWGLTVEKYWSDDDFILSHDNIYFAVYYNGEPIPGTVRRMHTEVDADHPEAEYSLYYYFRELISGASFSDYVVKEVALTDPVVDENGYVTSYGSITPLGGSLVLNEGAVDSQTNEYGQYSYTVTYLVGEPTGAARNVRSDAVTNARPGVRIVKTDANGDPLPGVLFNISAEGILDGDFISGSDGLVTIAYPQENVEYTVKELETPEGYSSLIDSFGFKTVDGELILTGEQSDAVSVTVNSEDGMITIAVKNYKTRFIAVKIDSITNEPIRGACFALYRQVMGKNGPRKDYYPLTGYESLYSDENGVIPQIDDSLPVGTYYLTETEAAGHYMKLEKDICFSVDEAGHVIIENADEEVADSAVISADINENNELVLTLYVKNKRSFDSIYLDPQSFVADFGLDIDYNVKTNNYAVPNNSVYHYIGIVSLEEYTDYGTKDAPKTLLAEAGVGYKGKYGTLSIGADGTAHYEIDTMAFSGEDEFCLAAHVTKIAGVSADVYAYEKISYIPATTVYYEDDFVSEENYHDGVESTVTGHDFGKWGRVVSGESRTAQAADMAASDSANIFGYDPAYTDFATYSNNSAHIVSVSSVNGGNRNKNWPYMEFDFAGTGFDLISLTGCDSGMFAVMVYATQVDSEGNVTVGQRVVNRSVDTYYGNGYGRLYLDENGAATLTDTGKPLFKATDWIIEEARASKLMRVNGRFMTPVTTYYDTDGTITELKRYYDASGNVSSQIFYISTVDGTVTDEVPEGRENEFEPNYAFAYAEGWLVDANSEKSLYQIPVIKVDGLDYGTYRAHVEPRFTTHYDHWKTVDGYDYYDLYVDSIRIYDPAGSGDDGISSVVIKEAYEYSNESFERFTTLKKVIVGADSLGTVASGDEPIEGAVLVDGNVVLDSSSLADYKSFGPNNELYLGKDMTVAFELRSTQIPDDLQIQIRKISDSSPTMKVTYVNNKGVVFTGSVKIDTATDLSYSLLRMLGKNNVNFSKQRNGDYSTGMLVISNDGENESILSITNLKWTFSQKGGTIKYLDGSSTVTIAPRNVNSLSGVMAFAKRSPAVSRAEQDDVIYKEGTVLLNVRTGVGVQSLIVRDTDGNIIDPELLDITFEDIDDNDRLWTVAVDESEGGDYVFFVQAQNDGLVSGDALQVAVTVEGTVDGPVTQNNAVKAAEWKGFFEKVRSSLMKIVDVIKKIVSFFGVEFD